MSWPYDELWAYRQTCQQCPVPHNTAGLGTAGTNQGMHFLNKPNTFSKHSVCTLTGPLWELISPLQNPRGKEASYLLLSHFPPAAARPTHPQHKHLHRGGCPGVRLCYCTSRGCWVIQSVISAQRSRAKETQKHIQQFWGTFPQLHNSLKLWEVAQRCCSCTRDTI